MNFKPIGSSLMVGLMLSLVLIWFIPAVPIIPSARAALGGAPAILGLFNEQRKTNAVIDSTIGTSSPLVMDLNVTGGGNLNGFDVNITYAPGAIMVVGSSINGVGCPSPNCIFALSTMARLDNTTNNIQGWAHFAFIISTGPSVSGNGVMLRLTFRTATTAGASVLHIDKKTVIQNPSAVPYVPIDGYFDNKSTPSSNYSLSVNMTSRTILRKVSGTTISNLALTLTASGGTQSATTLKVLGAPLNTVTAISPNPCTPTCSVQPTLTVTINGGGASLSTTTASGTYAIAVIGNSTVTGVGQLIEVTWFRLIVQPPATPVYTLGTTSPTTFTQELGNYTLIPLTASLTSGANDSITIDSNCPSKLGGGDCVFRPASGKFPFSTVMNVTTNPASTALGTFMFNATTVTQGTYSETPVTHFLTFTITVIKTHDVAVSTMLVSRSFGYNSVSLTAPHLLQINVTAQNLGTGPETFTVNATAKVVLSTDFKLSYFDTNGNSVWDPGEPIIYDTDSSFTYTTGDIVIAGTAPALGSLLSSDFNLKFQDIFFNGVWTARDPVIYDVNGNGLYDSVDIIPAGQTGIIPPSPGVLLGSTSVSLPGGCTPNPPGCTQLVTINWDAGSLPRGNYRIGAAAVPVINEFVLANNYPTPFFVYTQKFKGDINGDCRVNIIDLSTVGGTFGKTITQVGYNAAADLNNDGVINIIDLVLVAGSFGQSC